MERAGRDFLPVAHMAWRDWDYEMHPASKAIFNPAGGVAGWRTAPLHSHPLALGPQASAVLIWQPPS